MRMWCRVGAQAVCVKREPWKNEGLPKYAGITFPRDGETYTIREVREGFGPNVGDIFLRFEEIVNPEIAFADGSAEMSFWVGFFQPLPKIDALRALLHAPSPELEDA